MALALAGLGIGTTVVPITSSVLSAVPPERSGMAASASNTSREIGAVTGVAILGSLVYSQLHVSLVTHMNQLGVPKAFQGLVINAIETGTIPSNTSAYAGFGKLVQEVIGAAYTRLQRRPARGAVPVRRAGAGRRRCSPSSRCAHGR